MLGNGFTGFTVPQNLTFDTMVLEIGALEAKLAENVDNYPLITTTN